MNTPDVLGWILTTVGFAALAAWLVFIVIAAVQIIRSSQLGYWTKVIWVAALVIFPLLGVVAWYAFASAHPSASRGTLLRASPARRAHLRAPRRP